MLFIVCFPQPHPTYPGTTWEQGSLICSLLYPQHLEQSLANNRSLINICCILESWQGYSNNSNEFWFNIYPVNFRQFKLPGSQSLIPMKSTTPSPTLWTIYKPQDKRFWCLLRNLVLFFWIAKCLATPSNIWALHCLCIWQEEVG